MRYLAFILAALTSAEMQAFELAPRLVVNITIDQLRSDYVEAFNPLYTSGGFRRILRDGIIYEDAGYPFMPVDKSSAQATISTGATPYYNGIIASRWLDRETLQPVFCVSDEKYGNSAARLKTSTVGDELKMSTEGKAIVYSFAADTESAIMSIGHAADGAFWFDRHYGWRGSSYYGTMPQWLKTLNNKASSSNPNDDVVTASLQAVSSARMGRDDVPDLLSVSLSAIKRDDESLTHWQNEMESVYMQLDNSLERLISGIELQVNLDQVLFVLTSTGYTDEEQGDLSRYRIPTGTFYINRTANLLNIYLGAIYGQGRYVEQVYGNQMYLNQKLVEQKRVALSEILSRSREFLVQNAGVADVYTSDRLLDGNNDILLVRNGYNTGCSGDITIEVAPGWKLLNEETGQTYTSRASVMPFPIIFWGSDIKPQRINKPVTVDCIAPTIAKAIRIRAPNACNTSPLF